MKEKNRICHNVSGTEELISYNLIFSFFCFLEITRMFVLFYEKCINEKGNPLNVQKLHTNNSLELLNVRFLKQF